MERHYCSAVQMAEAIRNRQISAVEALALCHDRIERHDGVVNALCNRVDERAFKRAKQADDALDRGQSWGQFHGLPMTVKEGYDLVGTPTTWGRPDFADNLPNRDAHAVRQFEAAGCVVFGKTNVPTDLRDWQSDNPLYGRTTNPWNSTRTPGGSSGGSAAALAAGYTFLEAGSDIGGSLRNPAHYCGVFAHKPSYGVIPTEGHSLTPEWVPTDISVCGPMARNGVDLQMAFELMLGVPASHAVGWHLSLPQARHSRLKDFRLGVITNSSVCPVADAVQAAIVTTAKCCETEGASVDWHTQLPVDEAAAHRTYIQLLRATVAGSMPAGEYADEQRRCDLLSGSDDSYRAQVTRAITQSYRDWCQVAEHRAKMMGQWAHWFERYDALLIPAAPTVAWPHDQTDRFDRQIQVDDQTIGYYDQLFWAGLTGGVYLPSTVCPVGVSDEGLPIGVQLVAPFLEDRTSLQLAVEIEKLMGGFKPPMGFA